VLVFRRWLVFAAPILAVAAAFSQTPPRPGFEVASIKPNKGCGDGPDGAAPSPGRLSLPCVSLRDLIVSAYGEFADGSTVSARIKKSDILGGPAWLDTDLYDLNAKAEGGAPLGLMAGPMLQRLLEDRCKLKLHRESREAPVYSLSVAKGGLKIQTTKEGSCTPLDLSHLPSRPAAGEAGSPICGFSSRRGSTPLRVVTDAHGMTMAEFAERTLDRLDRPVIDKTGLTGIFDIHLEYAPNPDASDGPSVFSAVQEQLGLKLSPDKGAKDVLVIDSIERPSEN